MASKAAAEVVYTEFDRIQFIKTCVKKEHDIQRIVWPERWGYLVDEYKELNKELRKGNDHIVLPHHECPVKNDFKPFHPDPRYKRPLPKTNNELYGWKYASSEVHPTYQWEKRIASRYFMNQVGWPYGSQP